MEHNTPSIMLSLVSGHDKQSFTNMLIQFISEKKRENDVEFNVTGLYIVGSRVNQTNRENSDLDILLLYSGHGEREIREDDMFSILNNDYLVIDDIKIDFIPYSFYKRGKVIINDNALKLF